MADSNFVASHVHTISSHNSDVNCVNFSTDRNLASCSGDKATRIFSISDFSELPSSPLLGHQYTVHYCTFSPFGTNIATCSTDGKAIIWDVKTGQKIITFQHPSQNGIRICRFSPNSAFLVTGGEDDKLCLWDLKTKQLIRTYPGHEGSVLACVFTPDSNFIVSGCNVGNLKAWDVNYGHIKQLVHILDGHDLGVTCCDFSPIFGSASAVSNDGQLRYQLLTGGQDNEAKLWLFTGILGHPSITLKLQQTLSGHLDTVNSCCYSPNGQLIATGSIDKTCRLWDANTGVPIHVVEGHSRFITSCAFSSDSQLLATGSNDKTVMVWRLTTVNDLIDAVDKASVKSESEADDITAKLAKISEKPLSKWTKDEVCTWLISIDMAEYCDNFTKNEIDGAEMVNLSQSMLISLGINALGHRNKLMRAKQLILGNTFARAVSETTVMADEYLCPITHEVMRDPVIAEDGYTYERSAIESWMSQGKNRSPMTNSVITTKQLTPNRNLKILIQKHLNG